MPTVASPGNYYSPVRPKVVVAFHQGSREFVPVAPLELERRSTHRLLVPLRPGKELVAALAPVRDILPSEDLVLLFPIAREDVPKVSQNWLEAIGDEDWLRGEHGRYIADEVTDDWTTFRNFLGHEQALWEACHELAGSKNTRFRLEGIAEASEIGESIMSRWESGRKGTAVGLNSLGDLACRVMVHEKAHSLISLRHDHVV